MYQQIYDHGTYYNPATSHYKSNGSVTCDRCGKDNLDVCIGYKTHDLCMMCMYEINSRKNNILSEPEYIIHPPARLDNKIHIAPFGYDSEGKIRTHWCTTPEQNRPKRLLSDDTLIVN